jgi:hypothetical protein
MPEVCSHGCTQRQGEASGRWRCRIRYSETLFTLATGRRRPPRSLPCRYQNAIQNAYAVLTRPPQTRAAHFKRLYRK